MSKESERMHGQLDNFKADIKHEVLCPDAIMLSQHKVCVCSHSNAAPGHVTSYIP